MAKHTMQELYQWQALPLNIKVRMTAERIRDWVNEFGEDGVYLSFSAGKKELQKLANNGLNILDLIISTSMKN